MREDIGGLFNQLVTLGSMNAGLLNMTGTPDAGAFGCAFPAMAAQAVLTALVGGEYGGC